VSWKSKPTPMRIRRGVTMIHRDSGRTERARADHVVLARLSKAERRHGWADCYKFRRAGEVFYVLAVNVRPEDFAGFVPCEEKRLQEAEG